MLIRLNNGVEIPKLGLGTFRAKGEEVYEAVKHALKIGYRHIDTAAIYENEAEVGRAVKDSGIPREEIFITTKLFQPDQGYLNTKNALHRSLEKLDMDYVDMFLIHWPISYQKTADSYQAMEELYLDGYTRAIGVSNFNFHHLEHLFDSAEIMPQVNQVECHIHLQNHKLHEFCRKNGIYLEAYAPLMSHEIKHLLENETLADIAKKYDKSIPQVAIRYQLQRDIITLPKSITKKRIEENFETLDFTLSQSDMEAIKKLNRAKKYFPEADNLN